LPEQHVDRVPYGFRRTDRDAHCVGPLIEIEGQEATAPPLLLDHPLHLILHFRHIEKAEHKIVEGVASQSPAREVLNPRDTGLIFACA
jgi:hypothetical protein